MLDDMFDRLAEPFPADAVSWRVGSTNGDKTKGLALAYLDARDVMDRLDLVCGPAGWQCRYSHANGKTVCDIGILVTHERRTPGAGPGGSALVDETSEWIWKADGAGDTDVEAEKGALSDAFKRAAVRWGVGRYLYGLKSPWVALEPAGRSYKIKESEFAKLRAVLTAGSAPRKSSAGAKRDHDFEFFKEKIDGAEDLETLGAVGREIKAAMPNLPVAFRDPLHDAYAAKREELKAIEDTFRRGAALSMANGAGDMAHAQ